MELWWNRRHDSFKNYSLLGKGANPLSSTDSEGARWIRA